MRPEQLAVFEAVRRSYMSHSASAQYASYVFCNESIQRPAFRASDIEGDNELWAALASSITKTAFAVFASAEAS